MKVIHLGFLVVLVELIHLNVPRRFIFVRPHIGETQRARIAVVKVRTGFSPLIGTRHKAPVRRQQRLAGWLNVARARPGRAKFKFCGCFIQADPTLIAGIVFIVGFIARGESDFVRVTALAAFAHFDGGKGSNVNTEHVGGIAGLEVEVGVPGGVRQVSFIFIAVGHIFTVALTLPVIDTAG